MNLPTIERLTVADRLAIGKYRSQKIRGRELIEELCSDDKDANVVARAMHVEGVPVKDLAAHLRWPERRTQNPLRRMYRRIAKVKSSRQRGSTPLPSLPPACANRRRLDLVSTPRRSEISTASVKRRGGKGSAAAATCGRTVLSTYLCRCVSHWRPGRRVVQDLVAAG